VMCGTLGEHIQRESREEEGPSTKVRKRERDRWIVDKRNDRRGNSGKTDKREKGQVDRRQEE
jgi:hypothetical protein